MSWGELGGVGRLLDRRLGRWGLQGSSVEQMTRFDERSCSSSRKSVSSAVDSPCTSFTASLTVSGVSTGVWVLDDAQVVGLGVVAAGFVAFVHSDVAVAQGGSGCETRDWGVFWSAVSRPRSERRRLRGAGASKQAGDGVLVVVDDVDNVDGGCACIVSGDVAAVLGKGGLVTRAGGSSSVWVAVSMVVGDVGVVWMSTLVVVTLSVWVSASSIKTAPRNSALAWAAIERQSPAPCPSVSHFRRSSSFPCCIPSSWPSSSPFPRAVSSFSRPSFFPASYPSL
jgi:hypothetical protein